MITIVEFRDFAAGPEDNDRVVAEQAGQIDLPMWKLQRLVGEFDMAGL